MKRLTPTGKTISQKSYKNHVFWSSKSLGNSVIVLKKKRHVSLLFRLLRFREGAPWIFGTGIHFPGVWVPFLGHLNSNSHIIQRVKKRVCVCVFSQTFVSLYDVKIPCQYVETHMNSIKIHWPPVPINLIFANDNQKYHTHPDWLRCHRGTPRGAPCTHALTTPFLWLSSSKFAFRMADLVLKAFGPKKYKVFIQWTIDWLACTKCPWRANWLPNFPNMKPTINPRS